MSADRAPAADGVAAHATGSAAPGPGSPRRRRILRGLTASVLTVAALTLAAEVALRVTGDRERALEEGVNRTNRRWVALLGAGLFEEVPDPVRRYAMRPGARAEVDGWLFRVSSFRTRGPDLPLAKPPGERRLLCLGDSFAFGLWADEEETLVGHLARMANEAEREAGSDVTWRPVNCGVPGYASVQQLRALEQDGLRLDPDVVVLYFNTNDIVDQGMFLDEELGALRADHLPLPVGLRRTLWDASHLYGRIVRAHTRSFEGLPRGNLDPRVPWSHARPANLEATAAAIRRIAALCRESDVPLFFVNQPLLTWTGDLRREDWPVLPLVRWADDLRAELGVPGASLLGLFRGYADGVDAFPAPPDEGFLIERFVADEAVQAYFAGDRAVGLPREVDFHLTGEGYGHLARVVYPRMAEAGLVP